ncbi:Uncharacterised protein [Bordetella pertussis]|nr:Uncharacterised protein [Bordetella pertussis]
MVLDWKLPLVLSHTPDSTFPCPPSKAVTVRNDASPAMGRLGLPATGLIMGPVSMRTRRDLSCCGMGSLCKFTGRPAPPLRRPESDYSQSRLRQARRARRGPLYA